MNDQLKARNRKQDTYHKNWILQVNEDDKYNLFVKYSIKVFLFSIKCIFLWKNNTKLRICITYNQKFFHYLYQIISTMKYCWFTYFWYQDCYNYLNEELTLTIKVDNGKILKISWWLTTYKIYFSHSKSLIFCSSASTVMQNYGIHLGLATLFVVPSIKWKCRALCSKIIKNFKISIVEY